MNLIWWLLKSSFVQSFAQKEVRHLATTAAGFILSWLLSHHANQTDATNISEGVAAVIIGGVGYLFSWLNETNNKAVIQVAEQTGGTIVPPPVAKAILAQGVEAQRAADQGQADKTHAAVDAADKAASDLTRDQILARLKDGSA